jgi:hypothetical protein
MRITSSSGSGDSERIRGTKRLLPRLSGDLLCVERLDQGLEFQVQGLCCPEDCSVFWG